MEEFSHESFIKDHFIFDQLNDFKDFYFSISKNSSRKSSMGIEGNIPLDSYFFESIMNTIDSIIILLKKGRLSDSYALLRKYDELGLYQTYIKLKIKNEFSIDNRIVEEINNWIFTEKKAPKIKKIDKYLKESTSIQPVYALYEIKDKDDKTEIENIRDRCNDFIHLNSIKSILLQDAETLHKVMTKEYNQFQQDSLKLFIRHFSFTLYLSGEYITDEDYFTALDAGIFKINEQKPWVSYIIQKVFNNYIKPNRPDVAAIITRILENDLE